LEAKSPVLVVQKLHKSFGDNQVLKGVNLQASEHNVISMIGASGSGKSTFLRCINLLEIPTSGTIRVVNETIEMRRTRKGSSIPANRRQVDRIRSQVGMVFQNFNLWSHMTVLDNVTRGPIRVLKVPKGQAVERAKALLDKVGIAEKCSYYPGQLSGGQQQRCAIARALAMEPKLLFI
jgi:ABC-type histidine transport system ATPase subunit